MKVVFKFPVMYYEFHGSKFVYMLILFNFYCNVNAVLCENLIELKLNKRFSYRRFILNNILFYFKMSAYQILDSIIFEP